VDRCLSLANSRRSQTRTSISPCLLPRAITPSARKGSNMRGKIVTKSILIDALRQIDEDFFSRQIDLEADGFRERHFVFFSVGTPDVQQHAASALVGLDCFSAIAPIFVDEMQADEIVQEELISITLSRFLLGNLDSPLLERIGIFRRRDAREFQECAIAVCAHRLDGRFARRGFIGRDEDDIRQLLEALEGVGPALDADFAADSVWLANDAERNPASQE